MSTEHEPDPTRNFTRVYSAGADTVRKAAANSETAPDDHTRTNRVRRRRAEITTSGPDQEVMDLARGMAEEGQRVIPQRDGSALIENIPPGGLERVSKQRSPPVVPKEIVAAVMKLAGDPDLVTQPDPHTFIIHNHPQT